MKMIPNAFFKYWAGLNMRKADQLKLSWRDVFWIFNFFSQQVFQKKFYRVSLTYLTRGMKRTPKSKNIAVGPEPPWKITRIQNPGSERSSPFEVVFILRLSLHFGIILILEIIFIFVDNLKSGISWISC